MPEPAIADLRQRIAATRWPTQELVADRSQGVQLATMRELARYWTTGYDRRACEARLNALPQFRTEIDGEGIHFIHVTSAHEGALPLITTHGWPGSVIELLGVIGPLTDPTAHGGSAGEAFDLVLPSVPGYGSSAVPAEAGWNVGRVAGAWAELMRRLGYTSYVDQGGDVGAAVTDAMGRQAPEGLLGIHLNLLLAGLAGGYPSPDPSPAARGARRDHHVPDQRQRLPHRAEHMAADGRLCPAGFAGRPGRLDARSRHRRLLQDLPRLHRRGALGRPHPGPRPGQHHDVLADRHRRLGGGPVVLGEHASRGPGGRAAGQPRSRARRSSSRSASPRSPARSSGPRAAGPRSPTPASPTSTRPARAATSRPGKSRNCSRPRSGRRSGPCADGGVSGAADGTEVPAVVPVEQGRASEQDQIAGDLGGQALAARGGKQAGVRSEVRARSWWPSACARPNSRYAAAKCRFARAARPLSIAASQVQAEMAGLPW
jgi:Epoxide hydrolase N terminus